ncbi:SPARC-like protein 1 [Mus pahari]|uniref:SPARC-like protein 1 n=1 Tax=Mus pahari TaxID=10093 RepID=UPI000A313F1B|nr:SPARC-like protein 1 [Mus pahari]XP_029401088.1 SPARC-like protein 1 [Mus pahari]
MKSVLLLLYTLGTTVAIPTSTRFLSDHSNPTTATLVTPEDATVPIVGVEATADIESHPNDKAEKPSALNSQEETHEQSTEQDKTYSFEVDLKDEEDGDGDLSVDPTEETLTLDLQEGTSEPQQKSLPENGDFPATVSTSFVDPNQRANITKGEENQEQPVSDSHQQPNESSKQTQDLMAEESQTQDPDIPNEEEENEDEEEEEEEEPEDIGAPSDNQEEGKEPLEEQPTSKWEGNRDQSDDTLEESSQPTQISKTEKHQSEQGNRGQESDSEAEGEDKAAGSKEHIPHTERQDQEGKAGLEAIGNQKDTDEKGISTEPTEAAVVPGNHGAGDNGGGDSSKRGAGDDYFIPSQEFLEAERMHSLSYYLKYGGGEETRTGESENRREAADNQGVKKAESTPNAEPSDEGNSRGHSADSCTNFQCKRGHTCKTDPQGKPHCVCQDPETCPPAKILDQACGTDNQTYASSCHLFATKCRLEGTKKGHQLQLDYFGACKSIPACTDFEVAQFPLRMRDWLKNILMQLYEPNSKHGGYLNEKQRSKVKKIYLDEKRLLAGDHPIELLLRDFKKNYHMYVYPVHWQFNELDQHPADRILTHSELAPLRASLVPMEHCITRFFEECDPNKDKHITLKEWGHCFGIKEEDIDENLLF